MATQIYPGEVGELGGGGNLDATTAASYLLLLSSARHLYLTAHNFSVDNEVMYVRFNPYLKIIKVTGAGVVSEMSDVQLGIAESLDDVDTMYIGSMWRFSAVKLTFATPNATASVLTAFYWDSVTQDWAAVSNITDGTDNGGATFGQDGSIDWDPILSTDWEKASLTEKELAGLGAASSNLYWIKLVMSVDLHADTDLDLIHSADIAGTNFFPLLEGQSLATQIRANRIDGIHNVQYLMGSGTGELVSGWAAAAGLGL